MKDTSAEFAVFAERAYKTFLELLRHELQKNRVNDINAIQVFMLLNIDEGIITMSEILSKGYYSGSNASYNLKKMLQNGYLTSTPSSIDKRSQYLSLSDKGKKLLFSFKTKLNEYLRSFQQGKKFQRNYDNVKQFLLNIEDHWKRILRE